MQEGFWQNEISLKFAKNSLTNDDINFLMMALDDGPYFVAAGTIAKGVLKEFANENLKINFTLSVLEKMVNLKVKGVKLIMLKLVCRLKKREPSITIYIKKYL